ncbi:MAG: rhodanese-like domain-containing protein [Alicyclobacillus sp.]|nr:rhodanese-like domain-containing protein [Alicyclobacillus sp.]
MPFELDGIPQYSAEELQQVLRDHSAKVIDVRTQEEYRAGHIPGVPLRPMQELPTWMPELDPQQPYVFVCRSGNRSQRVALFLKEAGFAHVANFSGGMLAWPGETVSEED